MSQLQLGYFVGSLSKESINRRLAEALVKLAPEGVSMTEIPIGSLPLYNRDFDVDYPAEAIALKEAVTAVDGLVYVTPEYNRAIPGALKNAIDWASRPWGENALGKPSATIGTSPGAISTAVAQQQLKDILLFCDAPVMGQPEGYVQFAEGLIDANGNVADEATRDFLSTWIAAFAGFVKRQHS